MWFRLPEGCTGLSVEQQEFGIEAKDEEGRGYFRAPDHFAPRILMLKGFSIAEPPEGSPDDLPKADPLRDTAIANMSREAEGMRTEIANLRSDLIAANARVVALVNERDAQKLAMAGLQAKVDELEDKE
jgi:hypothetical protein